MLLIFYSHILGKNGKDGRNMNEKYYGNEPIKDQKEVEMIFKLYEESGVLHYQDMMKLKKHLQQPKKEEVCEEV